MPKKFIFGQHLIPRIIFSKKNQTVEYFSEVLLLVFLPILSEKDGNQAPKVPIFVQLCCRGGACPAEGFPGLGFLHQRTVGCSRQSCPGLEKLHQKELV